MLLVQTVQWAVLVVSLALLARFGSAQSLSELSGSAHLAPHQDRFGDGVAVFGNTMAVAWPLGSKVFIYDWDPVLAEWTHFQTRSLPINGQFYTKNLRLSGNLLMIGNSNDGYIYERSGIGAKFFFVQSRLAGGCCSNIDEDEGGDTSVAVIGQSIMRRDATTGLFVVEQILPQVQTRYALSIRGGVIATSGSQTLAIYEYSSAQGQWNQVATFNNLNARDSQMDFGDNGNTLVVGVPAGSSGAVHVLKKSETTGIWSQVQLISSSQDDFGTAVSMESDSDLLVVGSENEQANLYYREDKNSNWVSKGSLFAPGAGPDHRYGSSVAVSGDLVVVGAPGKGQYRGSVFYAEFPPTSSPTVSPTMAPTPPTSFPTTAPSTSPSTSPTLAPSSSPTISPTMAPTTAPTTAPSSAPSTAPTFSPSETPTSSPSASPTASPTSAPTVSPTPAPTSSPSSAPVLSASPTLSPSTSPSTSPSSSPAANVNAGGLREDGGLSAAATGAVAGGSAIFFVAAAAAAFLVLSGRRRRALQLIAGDSATKHDSLEA